MLILEKMLKLPLSTRFKLMPRPGVKTDIILLRLFSIQLLLIIIKLFLLEFEAISERIKSYVTKF